MQVTYAWGRGRHGVLAREDDQDAPVEAPVTVNGDLEAFGPVGAAFTYFEPDTAMKIGSIYPEAGPVYGGTPITMIAILSVVFVLSSPL